MGWGKEITYNLHPTDILILKYFSLECQEMLGFKLAKLRGCQSTSAVSSSEKTDRNKCVKLRVRTRSEGKGTELCQELQVKGRRQIKWRWTVASLEGMLNQSTHNGIEQFASQKSHHNFSFSLVLLKCFLSMLNLNDNFNWVQLRETQQDIHPGSFFLVCWVSYEWPFKNMCYCDYVLSPIFMAAVFHTYIWPIRCLIIKKWQENGSNLIFNGYVLCFYKTQISWRSIAMCHTSEVIPHQNGFSSHRGTMCSL